MNVSDVLTDSELALIKQKSDLRAGWAVLCQWTLVVGIFAAVAAWTNPFSVVLGTVLLGGRYLGFGVLDHECGHQTLFRTRWLNDFVGAWLTSPPGFNNVKAYMRGHVKHHRLAGSDEDPDLPNYRDYPITRERLRRKLGRDITGRTGVRTLKRIARATANLHRLDPENRACMLRGLAVNLAMFGVLAATGHPWLYLMWIGAMVFVAPLISRVRQVAEHGGVPDLYDVDPRKNTRTVYANPLVRLMFPHGVNYHLEHHFVASAPIYRLKTMHRLLKTRGFYDGIDFPSGYIDLLTKVTVPTPAAVAA